MDDAVAAIVRREVGTPPDRVERVDEGLLHETYRVEAGSGAYVLQFASGEDDRADSLRRGLHCYRSLRDSGVPVPEVVTEDPRSFDGREYVLVERLPGESGKLDIRPDRTRAAGRCLARIHGTRTFETAGWIRVADGEMTVEAFDGGFGARLRRSVARSSARFREAGLDAAARAVEGLFDRTETEVPGRFEAVLCHDDFSPDNVLFRGDEVTGVLDFDRACAGHRYRDVVAAANAFWMHDPGADWRPRATFYEGYRDEADLDGAFERAEPVYRVATLARLVSGMLDHFPADERAFYSTAIREATDRID